MKVNEHRTYWLAIISLGVTLFLIKLWQGDLRGDSIFYAEVAKEIVQTGDWFTLHHGSKPYFNKPPLLFWLTALNYKIFGISDFSARLWSPLLAFLAGLLFYKLARSWFEPESAFLATCILFLTKDYVKDNMGLHLDSIVILSMIGYLFAITRVSRISWLLSGFFLTLGLLGKGPQALYGPTIAAIYKIITKDYRISYYSLAKSVLFAVGLSCLWVIPAYLKNREEFFDVIVLNQILGRMTGEFKYSKGKTYYIKVLLENYWPWLVTLPIGFYILARRANLKQQTIVFSWVAVVAISLAFPKPEYGRYLLPLYPAFSLVQGFMFGQWFSKNTVLKVARLITKMSLFGFVLINILPIEVHTISYSELREVRPLIEYHKNRGDKVFLLWPRLRTYSAALFYLDIPPENVVMGESIPFNEGLVLIEVDKFQRIPLMCEQLFMNKRYALMKCRK